MLKVYKPTLEDLWFREKLMSDKDTMSYNNAYGGTIPFPKVDWEKWYQAWVNGSKVNTFYRYLQDDKSNNYIGEIAYHFDKRREIYICSVIILSQYRNQGFGSEAINMICSLAKENGVLTLYDNIAADNPSVKLFLKNGFTIDFQNEEIIMVKKVL
ncbi:GNAT family N-acetyltransferase [Candidatus Epulonipiscium fishelsonii]|nr:GNAT family N-acetyltransferase [Epulopiscium sp. SCG-C06WGA-EpuloA1]